MKRVGTTIAIAVTALGAISVACALDRNGTRVVTADAGYPSDPLGGPPPPGVDGSVDDAGAGGEAGGPLDAASVDAALVDAGSLDAAARDAVADAIASPDAGCPGVLCGGSCLTDDSCAACPSGHLLCAATRTCGDCSHCAAGGVAFPVACYVCDATGRHPVGTCQPDDPGAFCLDSIYPDGGAHCACPGFDVTACPGSNQVCVQVENERPICVTCGETFYATDQAACQGNASCSAASSPPRCQ